MTEEKRSGLDGVEIFSGLSDDSIKALESAMERRRYSVGEILFNEGDAGDGCYVVKEGKVMLFSQSKMGGGRKIFDIIGPGDVIGEMSLIDGEPRCTSAQAVAESVCEFLSKDAFEREVLSENDAIRAVLGMLVVRLRKTDAHIEEMVFQGVPARLAGALLRLSERFGREEKGKLVIEMTHADLADLVGTSREYASKFLAQFQRDGCIVTGRGKIEILDMERLKTWIN